MEEQLDRDLHEYDCVVNMSHILCTLKDMGLTEVTQTCHLFDE